MIKVNSVNGDSVDAQRICMAACLKHKGATGCEVIWDQGNRGCYIHTSKVIDHGNRVPHHKFVVMFDVMVIEPKRALLHSNPYLPIYTGSCWIFSKCTDETGNDELRFAPIAPLPAPTRDARRLT